MDSATLVVVIVGCFGIITPTWLTWWNNRIQTKVAKQVKIDSEFIRRDMKETKEIAVVSHALLNSNYTTSLKATQMALRGQLLSEKELRRWRSPTVEELAISEAIVNQLEALDKEIEDRLKQQSIAEAQIKNSLEIPVTMPKEM